MCDVSSDEQRADEFADDIYDRLRAREERMWGKRIAMPDETPRWPPRHDILNWQIGQRIRARRSWGYVFQDQLARAIGISQSALSRIELGLREIGVVELVRIAALLETTPEELLYAPKRNPDDDDY
jgi:DNA-binding Xre family transcriptional regulator